MNDILACPVCQRPFEKRTGSMYLQWPYLCSSRCIRIYALIAARSDGPLSAAARAIMRRGAYPGTVIFATDEVG